MPTYEHNAKAPNSTTIMSNIANQASMVPKAK